MSIVPDDVLRTILSLVPYQGSNWLHCRVVCRLFLSLCKQTQIPRDDRLFERVVKSGDVWSFKAMTKNNPRLATPRALYLATCCGHGEIVRELLTYRHILDPREGGAASFDVAFRYGLNRDIVIQFLRDPRTILCDPVQQTIVESSFKGAPRGHPLQLAAERDDEELVQLIKNHPNYCPEVWENAGNENQIKRTFPAIVAAVACGQEKEFFDMYRAPGKTFRTGTEEYNVKVAKIIYNAALKAYKQGRTDFARTLISVPLFPISEQQREYVRGLADTLDSHRQKDDVYVFGLSNTWDHQ